MTKTLVGKLWACALALILVVGLMPAIQPATAYAATTITSVELTVDFDNIVLNASVSGADVQATFANNRGISDATNTICRMDKDYSIIAEKIAELDGFWNRSSLKYSDELLTEYNSKGEERQYYLLFNLIQRNGYEFPAGDTNLPVSVKVNGKTMSGVHVQRYNSDSIDVWIPVSFDNGEIVTGIELSPRDAYAQSGKSRSFQIAIAGSQNAKIDYTLTGNTQAATKVIASSKIISVNSNEPAGTKLTLTATAHNFPEISDSITFTVINGSPTIDSVKANPSNCTIDVSNGSPAIQEFKVDVEGTADHGFTVSLQGAKNDNTKVISQTSEGFSIQVSATEPSSTLRCFVTSTADPNKRTMLTINVKGLPRINAIDLIVDTSKLYFSKSETRTGAEINSYLTSDYLFLTDSSSTESYIDFGSNYTFLVKRTSAGWERSCFKRVDETETLASGTEYYLRVNIDNRKNKSFWPTDLSSLTVTVNGREIGVDGYGCKEWYYKDLEGSIEVYIPLYQKGSMTNQIKQFAPGIWAMCTKDLAPGRFLDRYTVATYDGNLMYYSADTDAWYYLVEGSKPTLNNTDFSSRTVDAQTFYPLEVSKPGLERWDVPGDVNGSGKVDIIDAQIAYDIACGYTYNIADIGMKTFIKCDVNGDSFVDASDAFAIQSAIHNGWN